MSLDKVALFWDSVAAGLVMSDSVSANDLLVCFVSGGVCALPRTGCGLCVGRQN